MKNVLQGFILVGSIIFMNSRVSAQSPLSSSANISVTIMTELSLSKTIDLRLRNVELDSLSRFPSGTAVQTGKNTRKIQKTLISKPEIVPASFSLTGAGTFVYAVTLPATATAVNKHGEPIKVETYLTNKNRNTNMLRPDSTFTMGGKIRLASNQSKGAYVLVGGLALAVNYN